MFKTVAHIMLLLYMPFIGFTSLLLHQDTLNFAGQDPLLFCQPSVSLEPSPVLGICLMLNKFLLTEGVVVWETK